MTESPLITARETKIASVLRPLGTVPMTRKQAVLAEELLKIHWGHVYRLRRRFLANPVASSVALRSHGRKPGTRSFTVAAEQLGLSRSTVGKRITRLEARLSVRLLQRTTRSVTLTDEGTVFYEHCGGILQSLEAAEASMVARSSVPAGRLRIDVPVSLGRLQILPAVHAYVRRWPTVDVSISFNDRYVDLIEEGIDVAVRVGGSTDSALVSRVVMPHRLVTCASPRYIARHGLPDTLADLAGHNCLRFEHGGRAAEWRFQVDGVRRLVRVGGNFVSTQAEALRDTTTAGLGIGQLTTFLISDELRTGRLVPVLAAHTTQGEPLSIVFPVRTLLPPRLRAFIELLSRCWQPVPPWDRTSRLAGRFGRAALSP